MISKLKILLNSEDAYRLFFFFGTLNLILGIIIWIPLIWLEDFYPIHLHRFFVLYGFMGSYISGFLMTAIPRFSETKKASTKELLTHFFIMTTSVSLIVFNFERVAYIVGGLFPLHLLYFILKRFSKRKRTPPASFIFIPISLVFAAYSSFKIAWTNDLETGFLYHEAMLLSIILGIGSHLIPGILGHREILPSQQNNFSPFNLILPFFFIVNYIFFYNKIFNLISVLVIFTCFYYWKLYKLPKIKTALNYCLWVSGWMLMTSFVLKIFFNDYGIHITHAFFISSVTLLTLLVSIRVIQSHSIGNPLIENEKKIYILTIFILISAATRVSAIFVPSYTRHLSYSSLMLLTGILIYIFSYFKFLFR